MAEMIVMRNLWRKLHFMNVFTIATANILKTSTKRPTLGTKSGRSLIYRPGKRRPNFATKELRTVVIESKTDVLDGFGADDHVAL